MHSKPGEPGSIRAVFLSTDGGEATDFLNTSWGAHASAACVFCKVFATDLMHHGIKRNGTSFNSARHFCLDNKPIILNNDDQMSVASNVQVVIVWLHIMTLCLQGFFPTAFQPSNQSTAEADRLTKANAFKTKTLNSAVRACPQKRAMPESLLAACPSTFEWHMTTVEVFSHCLLHGKKCSCSCCLQP